MDTWDAHNQKVVACRACPRLVDWREQVAREKRRAYRDWEYWGKPVPGFGDRQAQVLIVGLAPGAHGPTAPGACSRAMPPVTFSIQPYARRVSRTREQLFIARMGCR